MVHSVGHICSVPYKDFIALPSLYCVKNRFISYTGVMIQVKTGYEQVLFDRKARALLIIETCRNL